MNRSVALDLKEGLDELFATLKVKTILVEDKFKVGIKNFITDFIKMADEIHSEDDIVNIWHIDPTVASKIFLLFNDVVFGDMDESLSSETESETSDPETDELELDQSSEND